MRIMPALLFAAGFLIQSDSRLANPDTRGSNLRVVFK